MSSKNIIVTGGLGFIGHNVVQLLEQQGHNVLVVDNETTYGVIPKNELSKLILERKQKIKTNSIYFCDIADPLAAKIFENFDTDVVIHLASFPRQKVVNSNPMLGSRSMSEGLLNLLEASVYHGVEKFVYVSSSMVYGEFLDGVREDATCDPQGQYGILKLAGEWLVRDYSHRTPMKHTIIRPSAVYGPRDVEDRVISKFFGAAMRNESIMVCGANERLDFTYVEDTARGIVKASLANSSNNNTYNITRGRAHTLLDAAELVQKIVGQGEIVVGPRNANFPPRGALNIEAAQRDFLYTPLVDIEQGFRLYYDWIKNSIYK